jgi:hypothetical protein
VGRATKDQEGDDRGNVIGLTDALERLHCHDGGAAVGANCSRNASRSVVRGSNRDTARLVVDDQVHHHQRSVVQPFFLPLSHFGVTRFDLLQQDSYVCKRNAHGGEAGGLDYRLFPCRIRCFGPW